MPSADTKDLVVDLNLTNLNDAGEADPLSEAVARLCVTAARLTQSPLELVCVRIALQGVHDGIAEEVPTSSMTEAKNLIQDVLVLLTQAQAAMEAD